MPGAYIFKLEEGSAIATKGSVRALPRALRHQILLVSCYNLYQHTYILVDLSGILVYEGNDKLLTSDNLRSLKNIYYILYYHNI